MLKVKDEDVSKGQKYNYYITQAKIPGPDLKKSISCYSDACSFMFIAVLFTMTRKCNQPRCPTTKKNG